MTEKEPELQEFGIRPENYDSYTRLGQKRAWARPDLGGAITLATLPAIIFLISFASTQDVSAAFLSAGLTLVLLLLTPPGWLILWGCGGFVEYLIQRQRMSSLEKSGLAERIRQYEDARQEWRLGMTADDRDRRAVEREARIAQEQARREELDAERARQRELQSYWLSLRGVKFERELANLYKRQGYHIESTPTSGDQGIDLILKKDDKTTIVQCKGHRNPIGPAIARELFGSMTAFGADDAILACTGGFTRGVYDFVRGKPITLVSAKELAEMVESVQRKV